jgi:mono/diheme cytochrome c family protein
MTPESIEIGQQVFFEYCSGCHGRRADGRGRQSLNLDPKPQNLRNPQFIKHLTDERLFASISGGVRGTAMQPFEMILTPEKRWHAINYIRSLTAQDEIELPNSLIYREVSADLESPVSPTEDVIRHGGVLFQQYCSSCHGEKADGKGKIAPNLVPAPRNLVVIKSWGEKPFIDYLNDSRLYDSIANGVPGTSMAPWVGVFSENELWEIIQFLRVEAAKRQEAIETSH